MVQIECPWCGEAAAVEAADASRPWAGAAMSSLVVTCPVCDVRVDVAETPGDRVALAA